MASNLIESVRRLQTQYEKLVERVEDERKATAKTMQKLAQLRSCNSDLEQECKLLVGRLIDEGIAVDDANTILNSQAFQNEGLQLESFIKREEEAKKCLACARQRKVELMEQRQSSIIASMANMKVFSAWEENAQFELVRIFCLCNHMLS